MEIKSWPRVGTAGPDNSAIPQELFLGPMWPRNTYYRPYGKEVLFSRNVIWVQITFRGLGILTTVNPYGKEVLFSCPGK
jgi:hypothetical protein